MIGDLWRQHLRLSLLRLLESTPGYEANESILHDAVSQLGIRATRDQIRGELTWLREQGLIHVDIIADLMIAKATERGCEVAKGLATHPGVKRPSPKG